MEKHKETDAIREKLDSFTMLQRKIDNQIERLKQLEQTMGCPSSPSFDGIGRSCNDGLSKIERRYIRKEELEHKIRELMEEETQIRSELEKLIEQLKNPDEQTVLEMRYLDRQDWWAICDAIYAEKDDYKGNSGKYLKRVFKIHGAALQALAKIYNSTKI